MIVMFKEKKNFPGAVPKFCTKGPFAPLCKGLILNDSEYPTRQRCYEVALSSQEKLDCKERALEEVIFVLMPNPWETSFGVFASF